MEIRLENGKNTANTLGVFFWSFFLNFTSFFPGGLTKNTCEMFKQLVLALLLGGAQAWTGLDASTGMSRRNLFGKVASGVIVAGPASAFAADLMCPVNERRLARATQATQG